MVMALPPPLSSKSFAEVVSGNRAESIDLKEPSVYRGEPAVIFSEADILSLSFSSPFKFALVGKFSHGCPALSDIRKVLESFDPKAPFTVGLMDNKHILMRFNHEDDFHRIWLREQWFVMRFPMRVFKWTYEFRIDAESALAPVWVSFPLLPINFLKKESLFSIGKTLGQPLKMDSATVDLTKPSVARVCIEMNLLKKFQARIWIGCGLNGFWQRVLYEKVPKYCSKCFKKGHEVFECKIDGGFKISQGNLKEFQGSHKDEQ
ncbi:hypothetical protein LguiA_030747 [Lonicera macranthoides]